MKLTSPAFDHQGTIPAVYTCDGDDISPCLRWDDVPPETQSFVLICDDPDAPMGTWDHWVLYNLPSGCGGLAEAIQDLPSGTLIGENSWGKCEWGGPCPPDRKHRYFFKLYALDQALDLKAGATKDVVLKAMAGHILAQAELMGRYARPGQPD